jgi:predicted transglutaminase-like cysteine proteinase
MQVFPGTVAAQRLLALALTGIVAGALASPAGAQPARPKAIERGATPAFQAAPHLIDRAGPHKFFTINQVLTNRDRGIAPTVTLVSAPASGLGADPSESHPFGVVAFRAPEGLLWVKWRAIEGAMAREDEALVRCREDGESCSPAAVRLNALVAKAKAQSGRAQLETVTHTVNGAIRYISDQAHHGTPDLWTAPLETLAAGMGDCEDYAILKYRVLREAGVSQNDLRIVLLRDTITREAHAVLAAQAGGRWYILDNRQRGFYEDKALPHYMPLFALDHEGVKLLAARYAIRPQHDSEVADTAQVAGATKVARADATPVLEESVALRGSQDTVEVSDGQAGEPAPDTIGLRASVE